jgi:hypothetical protein
MPVKEPASTCICRYKEIYKGLHTMIFQPHIENAGGTYGLPTFGIERRRRGDINWELDAVARRASG